MNFRIGIDVCTLEYIKQITNENLLHRQGTLWQPNGKGSKKEGIYVYA